MGVGVGGQSDDGLQIIFKTQFNQSNIWFAYAEKHYICVQM